MPCSSTFCTSRIRWNFSEKPDGFSSRVVRSASFTGGRTSQPPAGRRQRLGQVPNMYRTFAHAPKVLKAAVEMAQAIRSDLDAKLRELAYLKVTELTDCHV